MTEYYKDFEQVKKELNLYQVRKKPIIIHATQINWDDFTVHSLEGDHNGKKGDWLMVGVNNEIYVCADDIFKKTYDVLEESK